MQSVNDHIIEGVTDDAELERAGLEDAFKFAAWSSLILVSDFLSGLCFLPLFHFALVLAVFTPSTPLFCFPGPEKNESTDECIFHVRVSSLRAVIRDSGPIPRPASCPACYAFCLSISRPSPSSATWCDRTDERMDTAHSANAALAHINSTRCCRDCEIGECVTVIRMLTYASRRAVGGYDLPHPTAALLRGDDIWETRAVGVGYHRNHLGVLLGLHGSDLSSVGEQRGSRNGVEGNSEGEWSFIASNGCAAF